MKLNTLTKLMKWFSAISLACAATSLVGVPVDIDYNGSLADDTGSLLDGDYFFKFAIAPETPASAAEIYWSNAPWDATAGEPSDSLAVQVNQGVFSVMLEGVDSAVLGNADLTLHVWVADAADATFEYMGANPINSVPYAVVAGTAESVEATNIAGQIEGSQLADGAVSGDQIADGSINADKLGTITITLPNIDGNGNGVPGDPEDVEISMETIMRSISENSVVEFNNLPGRSNYEVYLRENIAVGVGASGTFSDPFPISHLYEFNGGLIPMLDIIDGTGAVITGTAGTPIPGLTFTNVMQDVDGDGLLEPRMRVQGTPTAAGTYDVRVRATNRWGQSFVTVYTVLVDNVDILATDRVRGYSTSLNSGARPASVGANLVPEVGGDDASFDVYGGDPVWFRFITAAPLADHIVVQWTVPNPNGGTSTYNISGEAGRTFYVNSPSNDGRSSSQGAIKLDENPWEGDVNHEGTYAASILFDWGQSLTVGADSLDNIFEGFVLPENSIQFYTPGAGRVDLFDRFTDTGGYQFGDENLVGQYFGSTPPPDTAFGLLNTVEAGQVDTRLYGRNPFNFLSAMGTAGAPYIRGTATTSWIQSKVQRVDTLFGVTYVTRGLNVVGTNINDADPLINNADPRLDMTGFGPLDGSGGLLGASFPALNQGVISDNGGKRGTYNYPVDGNPLTFGAVAPFRPITNGLDNVNSATLVSGNEKVYFSSNGFLMVTYWVHVTNGFIDSIAPITAIFEVGDNINIVNDLLDRAQVAGYPTVVGGDFGTTNGRYFPGLYPDEANNPANKVAHGVNNVAYVWNAFNGGVGFDFVNEALGNSVLIPGSSMVNHRPANDALADFSFTLDVDSGYSDERTDASVFVRSDIVIYDMFVQEIDLTKNRTDPTFILQGDNTTQDITIDQGDDLMLTVSAYVRPALFNAADEGGINSLNPRDIGARFFLTPSLTGTVRVEITNDITKIVDDVVGLNADVDTNHVPGPIDDRILYTWEVILENPLQAIAQTNVATGYISAVLSTMVNGVKVNEVSTTTMDANAIAPYGNGPNAVDGVLDTMVQMPLNPTIVGSGGGITITVNP